MKHLIIITDNGDKYYIEALNSGSYALHGDLLDSGIYSIHKDINSLIDRVNEIIYEQTKTDIQRTIYAIYYKVNLDSLHSVSELIDSDTGFSHYYDNSTGKLFTGTLDNYSLLWKYIE